MLGKELGEARGQATSTRLLPYDGNAPEIEASFTGEGTFLGQKMTLIGSYWESFRDGGVRFGDARMLLTLGDGGIAFFRGRGVSQQPSRYASFGDFPWTSDGLAHLKGVSAVVEYDILEKGGYAWRMWEWR
ncbi:MAG: hypothetical protein SGJ07_11640 [Rhodospirillaceae bacterium]|nr:hypothetical protein [Rhodospirillaceae bacterium]